MKVCPKCNKSNPSTFTRCPCGEDLSAVKNIDNSNHQYQNEKAEKFGNIVCKVFIAIFIIAAITFVALMIDGVSETMNENQKQKDDGKCDICGEKATEYTLYDEEYCKKHLNNAVEYYLN